MSFPLIEPALISYLTNALAGVLVTAELENDHPLPAVHVERIDGANDGFRLDSAIVDVDVYASTRLEAETLSHAVLDALLDARGQVVALGVVVTYVNVSTAPRVIPSADNPTVRRYSATYQIGAHIAPQS